ncbi:MAG: hypothetical protein HEEMFOPI_00058 [Holosporales bacterium]
MNIMHFKILSILLFSSIIIKAAEIMPNIMQTPPLIQQTAVDHEELSFSATKTQNIEHSLDNTSDKIDPAHIVYFTSMVLSHEMRLN